MKFRTLTINDYSHVIDFWREQYLLTPLDEFERVKLFLEKNPELSILVEDKGKIIGTVLGSFDGRRGSIQKLVVHRAYRDMGIGKKLVTQAVERIQKAGALDIRFNTDETLVPFYEKCGFTKDTRPSMILKKF